MCTWIVERRGIAGSAKGLSGWFRVEEALVAYDHPHHIQLDHAVSIDLMDRSAPTGARICAELSIGDARNLAMAILAVVERAASYEAV